MDLDVWSCTVTQAAIAEMRRIANSARIHSSNWIGFLFNGLAMSVVKGISLGVGCNGAPAGLQAAPSRTNLSGDVAFAIKTVIAAAIFDVTRHYIHRTIYGLVCPCRGHTEKNTAITGSGDARQISALRNYFFTTLANEIKTRLLLPDR